MKNFKLFLRWIFALPISFFAGILALFPVHWFLLLVYGNNYLSCENIETIFAFRCYISIETVERTIQAILVPFMIIKVTTIIVPNFKFYITCFLSLIFGVGLSVIHLMAQSKGIFSILGMNFYSGNWIQAIIVVFGLNLVVWMNLTFEYSEFKSKV